MSTGGQIQLEGCYVKYDNTSFFGAQEKMEVCKRCGPSIGYNSDALDRVDSALAYLVGGNGQYFRGGGFGSIQGVAQCVQDLSLSDCQECLSEACGRLRTECETSTWGDMYLGKCYIRYADEGNENLANNGNSSSNKSSGGGNEIAKWIGYILAALFGGGSLAFVAKKCCKCKCSVEDFYKEEGSVHENTSTDSALAYLVGGNGQYFRGGDYGSIQGLAQCVQDLSLSDCQDCLQEACGRLRTECETSTWGDMYLGKCYIRYADQGNDIITNNGNSSSNKSSGGGNKTDIAKWIGYILAALFGGGSLAFVAKNCCNINVYNKVIKNLKQDLEGAKKETEKAKSEAKSAKEKAEKAEKENVESMLYLPYPPPMPMPMPPPCPYMSHSNPNTCYYL
ncbi:hypothetical protein L1987_79311 [Smallanthus sonchifolius]|uniref:Uncharacterized protein n=1 Tax=Smallanthus sonchifolius TaxID=185202 RepID=A0ACB8ZEC1_9ASTR|nr:hypothetical protein L1987_79311 [Smallanthus sonchifolius]